MQVRSGRGGVVICIQQRHSHPPPLPFLTTTSNKYATIMDLDLSYQFPAADKKPQPIPYMPTQDALAITLATVPSCTYPPTHIYLDQIQTQPSNSTLTLTSRATPDDLGRRSWRQLDHPRDRIRRLPKKVSQGRNQSQPSPLLQPTTHLPSNLPRNMSSSLLNQCLGLLVPEKFRRVLLFSILATQRSADCRATKRN